VATKLTNLTGSGTIEPNSLMMFSYTEDVTSLEPDDLTGGAGQVSFSAIRARQKNVTGNLHPSSKLLINNTLLLEDDRYGAVEFIGRDVNIIDDVVSVTGNTIQGRLNVEVTAPPHGGTGSTLWTAIITYCNLVSISPVIDSNLQTTLDAIPVNFIGWQGNLWENLKALCAAVSLSDTDNIGLEMFINENELEFREAKNRQITLGDDVISKAIDIKNLEAEQSKEIIIYRTSYGVNQVIAEQGRAELTGATENVTISDSMQVDPGETVIKRFSVNASLDSVNQPVNVSAISTLPYTGSTGEYVVVGSDDLPVLPAQWQAQGGSLTVSLTENPNEIELVIVAPPATELPTADDPQTVTLGPYKIGVESSGEEEYPALYITGTGVFFETENKTFLSGVPIEYLAQEEGSQIDNIFMNRDFDISCRGVAAAQVACGPDVQMNITLAESGTFGETIGQVFYDEQNKFRVINATFSDSQVDLTAEGCANFIDFENIWTGKTFAEFTARAGDNATYGDQAMKFNEFTVIPLMEAS